MPFLIHCKYLFYCLFRGQRRVLCVNSAVAPRRADRNPMRRSILLSIPPGHDMANTFSGSLAGWLSLLFAHTGGRFNLYTLRRFNEGRPIGAVGGCRMR